MLRDEFKNKLCFTGQSVMASVGDEGEISGMTGELSIPDDPYNSHHVALEMLIEGVRVASGRIPVKELVIHNLCHLQWNQKAPILL